MATPVVRVGIDLCSGHSVFPPRPAITGSPDVFVNGVPVVRLTDMWDTHGQHGGQSITGSETVFVNGLPLCTVGDLIDCGSQMINGSADVLAG